MIQPCAYFGQLCRGLRDIAATEHAHRVSYAAGRQLVHEQLEAGRWYTPDELEQHIGTTAAQGMLDRSVRQGYFESLVGFKLGSLWPEKQDPVGTKM